MFEILTVCTGNICRSPLAEQMLRVRLADLAPHIASAGTRGLPAAPMTREAAHLAVQLGVPPADAAAHRSRFLQESDLETPDLVLAMSREHRKRVVELDPSRVRTTFTIREFARLARAIPPQQLRSAAREAGSAPAERLRGAILALSSYRGMAAPSDDPADDDVVDPYRQPWDVYLRSAKQLVPAIDATSVVIRTVAELS